MGLLRAGGLFLCLHDLYSIERFQCTRDGRDMGIRDVAMNEFQVEKVEVEYIGRDNK